MAKFPSQNKILYQTGALSNDLFAQIASGGVTGDLNLPKDLALLNRRGYASTTRKGVPLVYQCKIDFYMHDENGRGPSSASEDSAGTGLGTDLQAVMKVTGVQNNWVIRNAAVKWHAAREQMFKDSGIKKSDRGAYSHEIRYNYDSVDDTWLVPIDGDGDAFTGGTWDVSNLSYAADEFWQLKLVGSGDDSETDAFQGSSLSIGHAYLVSRTNQQEDTNLQMEEGPAKFSVLRRMLEFEGGQEPNIDDTVINQARSGQDNPPYEVLDLSASGDINHDITEPVELGRAIAGFGNAYGSMIVDIPFGLAKVVARVHDAADTNLTPSGLMCVEVLDIYEMQG